EKELRRLMAFKATHTREKKNIEDPDVWVEPLAKLEGLGSSQYDGSMGQGDNIGYEVEDLQII
ncbi:hypothetical protein HAX54_039350, partial [Datura stramonium]|nr:hypothetical protein [Datura stramonium]